MSETYRVELEDGSVWDHGLTLAAAEEEADRLLRIQGWEAGVASEDTPTHAERSAQAWDRAQALRAADTSGMTRTQARRHRRRLARIGGCQ